LVAEQEATGTSSSRVVGHTIYELHKNRLHVLNLAVLKDCWRQRIGSALVTKLKAKLSAQRRTRIVLEVRETNLAAQLFFRQMGFRAVAVLENNWEDTPEDAYQFVYRYRPAIDDIMDELLEA
jgi:ribosomal-protein-alanine N-acetyltransferase